MKNPPDISTLFNPSFVLTSGVLVFVIMLAVSYLKNGGYWFKVFFTDADNFQIKMLWCGFF